MAGDIPVYCSHDEIVDIMAVIPNPKNPNRHPDSQVDVLAKIIKSQGWRKPITVSKRSGFVVSGHGRLLAAVMLKTDKVPIDFQDYATEAEEYADLVADNRIAELSEIDDNLLSEILGEIKDYEDFNFELTGYADHDLEEILNSIDFGEETETEAVEDDYEVELPEEPKAKKGDIYQLGNHRLMCGDSTDRKQVETLLNGENIELLLTDPPYNMGYSGGGIIKETTKNVRERIKDIIDFDAMSIKYIANMNIGSVYIFTSKDLIPDYLKIFEGWKFNILTWVKTNNPPMCNNNFLPDIEYLLYFHNGKGRVWNNGLRPLDIYRKAYFSSRTEGHEEIGDVHPTMKPLKLLSDKIKISSNKNVLDLFGGSGSTLIACEQTGRKCYMMELDPKYIDVIIDRWEQFTGEKAILLESEERSV